MAIDRETIIKQIFNNTRVPATGWVSPVVDGYKAEQCGEFCKFDPAKAKALLEEAGGFKGDKITLSYNADAAHKDWTEATCNSIKQSLGVECQAVGVVDFATFRQQIGDRKMKGMFRNGWVMDYPSIENFLTPIYGHGAASNDTDYSNPAFDKLLADAAAATDPAEANAKYQEAEALLAADFPIHPHVVRQGHRSAGPTRSPTSRSRAFGQIDLDVDLPEVMLGGPLSQVPPAHVVGLSATAGRPTACVRAMPPDVHRDVRYWAAPPSGLGSTRYIRRRRRAIPATARERREVTWALTSFDDCCR